MEDVGCSCLLNPRCLHLLAVLRVLPVSDIDEIEEGEEETAPPPQDLPLTDAQRDAAKALWDAAAKTR